MRVICRERGRPVRTASKARPFRPHRAFRPTFFRALGSMRTGRPRSRILFSLDKIEIQFLTLLLNCS